MPSNASLDLFNRAKKVTPGGVQSGSRYRDPHPWYFTSAKGAWLTDINQSLYLDCIMGNGAVLLGHGHPIVVEAIQNALSKGLTCGLETDLSVEAAEKISKKLPGNMHVRFANTGTEAALHSIRIARAYTGRKKIAKFEGSYHGWADSVLISVWPDLNQAGPVSQPKSLPYTGGMLEEHLNNTIVLPFNDLENVKNILERNYQDIAAVIIEPIMIDIGFIPADPDFLIGLRKITKELGIVLIFDELLTGFRLAMGGAQEYYGIQADLCMFGKVIGNGFPISVVAGKPEIMELVRPGGPVAFQGTFNGHYISLTAVSTIMDILDTEDIIGIIQQKTEYLQSAFSQLCQKNSIAAILAGRAGHFHPYFVEKPVIDYRTATLTNQRQYKTFANVLNSKRIYFYTNPLLHHSISVAHDDAALNYLIDAMDEGLKCATAESEKGG